MKLVLAASVSVLLLAACSGQRDYSRNAVWDAYYLVDEAVRQGDTEEVLPLNDLIEDYERNRRKAHQKYEGKVVRTRGTVHTLVARADGTVYADFALGLGRSYGSPKVRCYYLPGLASNPEFAWWSVGSMGHSMIGFSGLVVERRNKVRSVIELLGCNFTEPRILRD